MESNTLEFPVAKRGPVVDAGMALDWYGMALRSQGEASLMALVRSGMYSGLAEIIFPDTPVDVDVDTFAFEYRLPHGRVDLAIFHADGSLTLVEAKDGRLGMKHVLCGLGQVLMYSLDVGMARGRPKTIRKALLWNSTGDLMQDCMIEIACDNAGIIPMQFGPIQPQLDSARDTLIKAERM